CIFAGLSEKRVFLRRKYCNIAAIPSPARQMDGAKTQGKIAPVSILNALRWRLICRTPSPYASVRNSTSSLVPVLALIAID
ncbi:hypothetical protein, partial [Paenibacillus dendritiformis]|uniref:hypothetical protein n=1 Tax=Paenibacillus dendritiformis TaxID=130049 RepID=UPI001B2FEE2B